MPNNACHRVDAQTPNIACGEGRWGSGGGNLGVLLVPAPRSLASRPSIPAACRGPFMVLPHVRPGVYAGSNSARASGPPSASFMRLLARGFSRIVWRSMAEAKACGANPVNRAANRLVHGRTPRRKRRVEPAKGHKWPSWEAERVRALPGPVVGSCCQPSFCQPIIGQEFESRWHN
jgi:hypothetical protein